MANELTASFNLTYDDGVTPKIVAAVASRVMTVTTTRPDVLIQSIATSATQIKLGDVGTIGAFAIVNLDPTNYVDVLNESSGKVVSRLRPDTNQDGTGGFLCMTQAGTDFTAPYAQANTGACRVLVFLCPP